MDKRRLDTEKELEDKVWKSGGWSPTRDRRIKKAGYWNGKEPEDQVWIREEGA